MNVAVFTARSVGWLGASGVSSWRVSTPECGTAETGTDWSSARQAACQGGERAVAMDHLGLYLQGFSLRSSGGKLSRWCGEP